MYVQLIEDCEAGKRGDYLHLDLATDEDRATLWHARAADVAVIRNGDVLRCYCPEEQTYLEYHTSGRGDTMNGQPISLTMRPYFVTLKEKSCS